MTVLRILAWIIGGGAFLVYSLYWAMFLPYLVMSLFVEGGWRAWLSADGPDGLAGSIFLWALVLLNPATVAYFVSVRVFGVRNARP